MPAPTSAPQQSFELYEGDMAAGNLPLPPELLSEIFHLAKPKSQVTHLVPLEVTLSHVSSKWRCTLLSDSHIWSKINIYSPKSIPRAEAYLSRTGAAVPLSVRVEIYNYDRRNHRLERRGFIESIVTFLKSCIHRCCTLLLFTYHESTAARILEGLATSSAPLLQRLRINNLPPDPDGMLRSTTQSSILTGGAPCLQFLEIEGIPAFPPLGSLVTLHLHNLKPEWFNYDSFKALCQKAAHLENLSLEAQSFITTWPNDTMGPSINLRSLRALKMNEKYPGLLVKFLLSINAPKLQSLWMAAETTSFDHLFSSPQFVSSQNKFTGLQYLTLECYNMRSLRQFGQVFPNITHFYIPEAPLFYLNHFTAAFTSAGATLWPKLHTLAMTAKSDRRQGSLKESLCKIISHRAELKVGLKKFLADGDLIEFLHNQESDFLNENIGMEELSTENYREPWWIMLHESHPESTGLS